MPGLAREVTAEVLGDDVGDQIPGAESIDPRSDPEPSKNSPLTDGPTEVGR